MKSLIIDPKISTPTIDIQPVISAIISGLNKIKDTIAAQPKSVRNSIDIK